MKFFGAEFWGWIHQLDCLLLGFLIWSRISRWVVFYAEIQKWSNKIHQLLPGGEFCVETANVVVVSIQWNCSKKNFCLLIGCSQQQHSPFQHRILPLLITNCWLLLFSSLPMFLLCSRRRSLHLNKWTITWFHVKWTLLVDPVSKPTVMQLRLGIVYI